MKQNLLNSLRLQLCMLVALFSTAFAGQAWGETKTKTEGFETKATSSTYNSTVNISEEESDCGIGWTIYYGTVSTSNKITGNNSAAIRYYSSSPNNRGYLQTTTAIEGLSKVSFNIKAQTSNGASISVDVQTSIDGSNWTNIQSAVSVPSSVKKWEYNITNGGKYFRIAISSSAQAPTSSNVQMTIDDVVFTYEEGGSTPTLETSDLAISGTSELTFDLYNNSAAQTISYTTSSTGAVTVSESEYVETSVSGNTITVTPIKVTPSAQTITISQAADDTYAAGTATFTVTVIDNTPVVTDWVKAELADLAATDIFVIVGNNGSNYALSNNNSTSAAPTAVAVTVSGNYITSSVPDNIKWNISGDATGYTFYPNGNTTTWLYCTNTNNGVRVGTNENKTFKIDNDYLQHVATERYVGIYNSSDWRCYTSINSNIENQTFTFYKYNGAPAPSITAEDVEIAYDATSGSIAYTLTNPVEGTTLTASSSESWLTVGTPADGTIALTCQANTGAERTATVTLTYGDITKTVTVTQAAAPVTYTTIPDIFAAATEAGNTERDVNVTFGNWVVSGVSSNNNVYVTDNNGNGFIIYKSDHGFAVNDKLSGTVIETPLKLYNKSAEFTNLTASTTGLTVTHDGTITVVTNKTIADLSGVNTGAVITLNNLTYDGENLSDGTNTIKPYNTLYSGTFETNKTYNVTGVYLQYNNTKEILPRSAEDIEEVATPTQSTVTAGTLNHVTISGLWDGNMEDITLGDNVAEGTLVYFELSVDEDYDLEVESVKVLDANNDEVYLTENQGSWSFTMPNSSVTINATATSSVTPATGDKYVKVTSDADLTSGQYLIVYEDGNVAFNGGLETLDAASNTISITINNNEITVTNATTAAEFTIDVTAGTIKSASGYYIGKTANSNGLDSNKSTTYTNTFSIDEDGNAVITASGKCILRYNSASDQKRFRYYKSGQQAIQLYKKVESTPETIQVTVGSALYTTFVAPAAVSFPEDVTAYIVTKINEGSMHMEEVSAVPAGTAVVVKAAEAGTYVLPRATETEDVTANLLQGSDGNVQGGSTIYVLANKSKGVGFYPTAESITVPAGRAYLEVVETGDVKDFIAFDFGGADGIVDINVNENAGIYNLAGQRVEKMQKGIYVVGGKKVAVK